MEGGVNNDHEILKPLAVITIMRTSHLVLHSLSDFQRNVPSSDYLNL